MGTYPYSIIATSFNDESEIDGFIQNILEQDHLPMELVIADGGSKDRTIELIKNYSQSTENVDIKLVTNGRLNIAQGYNAATVCAKMDIVATSGIGNRYASDYFGKLYNRLEQSKCDIVYSKIYGEEINRFSRLYCKAFLKGNQGLDLGIASNHGSMMKKEIIENLGYFYEDLYYAGEDMEFFNYAKEKGLSFECVDDAKVYWKVPTSFQEFVKQVRLYEIGNMQSTSNGTCLKRILKNIVILVLPIIMLLCAAFFRNWVPVLVLVLVGSVALMFGKNPVLIGVRSFVSMITCLSNTQYFNKEHKVIR